MDLNELLKTSPEGLAELQFKELKKHVIGVLMRAKDAVDRDDFTQASVMCCYSPAGDECGTDHDFINFAPKGNKDEWDFAEVCEKLHQLKELFNPKKKK